MVLVVLLTWTDAGIRPQTSPHVVRSSGIPGTVGTDSGALLLPLLSFLLLLLTSNMKDEGVPCLQHPFSVLCFYIRPRRYLDWDQMVVTPLGLVMISHYCSAHI